MKMAEIVIINVTNPA